MWCFSWPPPSQYCSGGDGGGCCGFVMPWGVVFFMASHLSIVVVVMVVDVVVCDAVGCGVFYGLPSQYCSGGDGGGCGGL